MKVLNPADDTSWFYTHENLTTPQKSVTHESLEHTITMGRHKQAKTRIIAKKQLNFQSYPTNDFQLSQLQGDKKNEYPLLSSYQRDYVYPVKSICPYKNLHGTEDPDWLFNRKCPNVFEMHQWSSTKFMDDHFTNLTSANKKKNFFRQLRNVSFKFT